MFGMRREKEEGCIVEDIRKKKKRLICFCVVYPSSGGSELGTLWYHQGKLEKKRNTFTDFIDVAEHLVEAGYTNPRRLTASGVSAGGLLMGKESGVEDLPSFMLILAMTRSNQP